MILLPFIMLSFSVLCLCWCAYDTGREGHKEALKSYQDSMGVLTRHLLDMTQETALLRAKLAKFDRIRGESGRFVK